MKKSSKRIITVLLSVLLMVSILPVGMIITNAASLTQSQFNQKLNAAQALYPSGTQKHTWSVNGTVVGWQCHGYARWLSWYVWGTDFANGNGKNWTLYKASSSSTPIDKLVPGDVVRYRSSTAKAYNHTIFITSISGSTIYFTDCNSDGNDTIKWNRSISKSTLNGYLKISLYGSEAATYGYIAHYTPNTLGTSSTPSYTESKVYPTPLKAYTLATGKTTVYTAVNGSAKTNKIYDTDLCTISKIYTNGWCKVSFPLDAGGTDTGYVKTSVFFNTSYDVHTIKAAKQITTYKRSDLSQTTGYAGSGDKVYVIGHNSKAVQIAYPLTAGGYKVGWVPISPFTFTVKYNANGGTGSMSSSSVKYQGTLSLKSNAFTKTGYTFAGWNVYRSSDKTWYVSGIGWKTASEISNKGYSKKLYSNKASYTFTDSWTVGAKTNDTYTFYAVWKANVLSVSFNTNGGTISSDKYKKSNNFVYYAADNSKTVQDWTYNKAKANGLPNVSTFGLTKVGYKFVGWGTSANGGTVFDQNNTKLLPTDITSKIKAGSCSITLYAIWEPILYTVKFDTNGGEGGPAAFKTEAGGTFVFPEGSPVKTGYTFLGWATQNNATQPEPESELIPGKKLKVSKDTVYYAVWEKLPPVETHIHEWEEEYRIDKQPTCTAAGIKSIHCKTCGETKDVVQIPALGHSCYEVIEQEPTCTEPGKVVQRCTRCGCDISSKPVPETGHTFETKVIKEASCSEEGYQEDICTECGAQTNKVVLPKASHNFSEWTVVSKPTAERDGLEQRTCYECGEKESRAIEYVPDYDENAPVIATSDVVATPGEEISVEINIQNNPGISSMKFMIDYDETVLTMTGFDFSKDFSSENNSTSEDFGALYSVVINSSNKNTTACGVIATITFKVKETAATGAYTIDILYDPDEILNASQEKVSFTVECGTVHVNAKDTLLGDVNGDGTIDAADAVMIQRYDSGLTTLTDEQLAAADVNADGLVDAADAVKIQRYDAGLIASL